MNVFANTWRQLVRRRLWPVAALLLAGVVAVPFVLAKDPEPVVAPPPPPQEETTAAEEAATGDPLVALTEQGSTETRRRRVLGARKDPFEPAPAPKAKKSQEQEQGEQAPKEPEAPSDPSGGAPADPGPSDPPVPAVPAPKKKTYPPDSLIVRFGDATTDLQRMTLTKLSPLPPDGDDADAQPLLVYTGLTKDGKSAIFMVDAAAEATGDGECKPHPSNCETIHLRKGETEFFDIKDENGEVVASFQLDLVDIKTRKKSSATRARATGANASAGAGAIEPAL
jgi:Mrp family chromosome partitioning ATPase